MRLAALGCVLWISGCVDYFSGAQSLEHQQTQESAAATARWDLYLNSRIDDLYARVIVLEACRCGRGCPFPGPH